MVNKQLLIDIGANWREKIKVEINRCEQLADAIRKLAGNLYLASGGTKGDAKSWDKTFLKSRESAQCTAVLPSGHAVPSLAGWDHSGRSGLC